MIRRIVLPSLPTSVAAAVRFAEAAAREDGRPAPFVDRVALATGEAVGNAVSHGNRMDPLRHVIVEWRAVGEGGELLVQDEGCGLPETRLDTADLPPDPLSTGGRGLFIMKQLAEVWVEAGGCRVGLRFSPQPGDAS